MVVVVVPEVSLRLRSLSLFTTAFWQPLVSRLLCVACERERERESGKGKSRLFLFAIPFIRHYRSSTNVAIQHECDSISSLSLSPSLSLRSHKCRHHAWASSSSNYIDSMSACLRTPWAQSGRMLRPYRPQCISVECAVVLSEFWSEAPDHFPQQPILSLLYRLQARLATLSTGRGGDRAGIRASPRHPQAYVCMYVCMCVYTCVLSFQSTYLSVYPSHLRRIQVSSPTFRE